MKGSFALLVPLAAALCGAAPGEAVQPVSITVQNLRSMRGDMLVCIARQPRHFPDCSKDPDQRHFTVRATAGPIPLAALPPGDYAIAIIHDENGNGKLDTFAGVPREGVGFSRNPPIRFGAPSFQSARFTIAGSPVRQDVKVKYFL
jgi:uncharacterized protein (DUF2141 family)